MGEARFERLSALDAAFLTIEQGGVHMHVGAVVLLDAKELKNEHGGVDFARIRSILLGTTVELPRLRQRLQAVPGVGHWVWAFDPHFDIDCHVRHVALPRPGNQQQLSTATARICSQRLDRARPLWEMWVVEGLSGDRFALVAKLHHCMMDGVGLVGLLAALVKGSTERPVPVEATPAPSPAEVLAGELKHRFAGWKTRVLSARDAFDRARSGMHTGVGSVTRGLRETLESGLHQVSPTSLNPEAVSPERRFDMLRLDLADVKRIKTNLGGTVNDVVLATVAGALRRYLARHGTDVDHLERFRVLLPTNTRKAGTGSLGNRISLMLAPLPVQEADPRLRLELVREHTSYLKNESGEVKSAEFLEKLDDDLGLGLINASFRLAMARRAFNVVVTNVAGPPIPLKLFGASLLGIHALVPLFEHQGLGIAIFSYHGGLYWGFNADWNAVPDLGDLVDDVRASFAELLASQPAQVVQLQL